MSLVHGGLLLTLPVICLLDLWQDESIPSKLLNIVEHISDSIDWQLVENVHPLTDHLEDPFVLIRLADVANDVVAVGAVNSQHLGGVILVLHLLEDLLVDNLAQLRLPTTVVLLHYARNGDADNDEELLMDVEHEVLQIGVHTRLVINRGLLISQQVVELHDANGYGFILLSLHHLVLENGILDDLVCNECRQLTCVCHIPPIVTVDGAV